MNTRQDIDRAFVKALTGRSFPWHSAGFMQTGGDCWAYRIDGETSEDLTESTPWFALITDNDGPFIDTLGPYSVSIWSAHSNEQIGEPVEAANADEAVTMVAKLYRTFFGEAYVDADGIIRTVGVSS